MDFPTTASPSSAVYEEDHDSTCINVDDHETHCWGCGLRVIGSRYESVSICSWCGAITKYNSVKSDNKNFRWRRLCNWCCICTALSFMLLFTCGGIWAIYPMIFSISYFYGVFHLTIAAILSISTVSSFCFVAFRSAGAPPMIIWGSYPTVGRGALENYNYCDYCSKPKPPRAHHCRSCGMCVLDMDHHCPFIGNCVGAGNHRCFIIFLISTVISITYVAVMTSQAASHSISPHLDLKPLTLLNVFTNTKLFFMVLKENTLTLLASVPFLPVRGFVLLYLMLTSFSVGLSLCVLLWQQLRCIYTGKSYLSFLKKVDSEEKTESGFQNLVRFFGCPYSAVVYLPSYWKSRKSHKKI